MMLTPAGTPAADNSAVCSRVPPAPASPPSMSDNVSKCTDGPWKAAEDDTPDIAQVRYETEHFAFRWHGNDTSVADATEAGKFMESTWKYFTGDPVGMKTPSCEESSKFKYNVHIQPGAGLVGGSNRAGVPAMWIGPEGLQDHWGMAHEMTHGLQSLALESVSRPHSRTNYWAHEGHANWTTHQLPEHHNTNAHCSEMLVNYPHLYYGSTRMVYCNWQFFEYVKNHFGYKAIANLWGEGDGANPYGLPTDDILGLLGAQNGWSIEKLNDVFGAWAISNVGWNYTNPDGTDQGKFYRETYGPYDNPFGEAVSNQKPRRKIDETTVNEQQQQNPEFKTAVGGIEEALDDKYLRITRLDPVRLEERIFAVQELQAPQRWGYNIVRLIPDANATAVTVSFKGIVQTEAALKTLPGRKEEPSAIPEPASGWRWGLVTIGTDGAETGRSKLMAGSVGETSLTFKQGERMYLVVVGTPTAFQSIGTDQPYYSIYRYPWMAKFMGAFPQGFEPNAPTPTPTGRKHKNGGGWVAEGATVDETAYVGPYAVVLGGKVTGKARVEDHAIILNGEVSDSALVGGLTVVSGDVVIKDNAVVKTSFRGPGIAGPGAVTGPGAMTGSGAVIGSNAVVYGDVEWGNGLNLNEGYVTGLATQEAMSETMIGFEVLKKSVITTSTNSTSTNSTSQDSTSTKSKSQDSTSQDSRLNERNVISSKNTASEANVDSGEVTAKPSFTW